MKKTCFNCKAFYDFKRCTLGYKIIFEDYSVYLGTYKIIKPGEECPKPKTLKELCKTKSKFIK